MSTPRARFSIRMFLLLVGLQLIGLFLILAYGLPKLWAHQLACGFVAILVVFLNARLFLCFFEWWFHRYVLHATIHPSLIRFSRGHRNHHALTAIQLRPNEAGPGRIVLNKYPITTPEQFEDAAFPIYALAVFWLLFTPLFVIVQWLLPDAPIMLGGYLAVASAMSEYEIFHAIEHYPYEWWKRAVEAAPNASRWKKFQARTWRKVYAFHHFHHANISANEAISGFFGLPVADWVLRTYNQPQDLLLEGRVATAKEFAIQPPWPFVAWLDRWARRREAKILHAESLRHGPL